MAPDSSASYVGGDPAAAEGGAGAGAGGAGAGAGDVVAVPLLERSLALATQTGARGTMFEALRHLGIADHRAGRLDEAGARLEESSRLSREDGLLPGVAANLVGLAYIAAAQGRHDDAQSHLTEAATIATQTGAHRVLHHITEARTNLR